MMNLTKNKPNKPNKPKIKEPEKICPIIRNYVWEIYHKRYMQSEVITLFINFVIKHQIKEFYYCKYQNEKVDKHFLRVAMLNITEDELADFEGLLMEEREKTLEMFRRMRPFPQTEELDMELIKFLAFKCYQQIEHHFSKYEKNYQNSPIRLRNKHGQLTLKKDRAKMTEGDWLGLFHHIFNMEDYSYLEESYLYLSMYNDIRFNSINSNLKS